MQLCDIFLLLGEENFKQLVRSISLGRLKTFQLFDRVKTRLYLNKLNSETLRKAEPRMWARIGERDDDFATDISQAILISHLDMIRAVLDHLGIPHEDGFFPKDADISKYLAEGWQQKASEQFPHHLSRGGAVILYQSPRLGNRQGRGGFSTSRAMNSLYEAVRAGDHARVRSIVAADPTLTIFAAAMLGDSAQAESCWPRTGRWCRLSARTAGRRCTWLLLRRVRGCTNAAQQRRVARSAVS